MTPQQADDLRRLAEEIRAAHDHVVDTTTKLHYCTKETSKTYADAEAAFLAKLEELTQR